VSGWVVLLLILNVTFGASRMSHPKAVRFALGATTIVVCFTIVRMMGGA
jgi:hypothetical protein